MPNPYKDNAISDYYMMYKQLRGALSEQQCQPLLELLSHREVTFDRCRDLAERLGHSDLEAGRLWMAVEAVMPLV